MQDKPLIAIPVFEAINETSRCLESVALNLSREEADVSVWDDGSSSATAKRLAALCLEFGFDYIRGSTNRGYVATMNAAFASTNADVIALNSDTVCFPGLVSRLRRSVTDATVASVTAVTNFGTIASWPNFPLGGELSYFTAAQIAAMPERYESVEVPTAVGHCVLYTRRAIEVVGPFNEKAFPRGYGEENDWSMRARVLGFRHVLNLDAYVYHEGGASFGIQKESLTRPAEQTLRSMHPDYDELVQSFLASGAISVAHARMTAQFLSPPSKQAPILHISHADGGGVGEYISRRARLENTPALVMTPSADHIKILGVGGVFDGVTLVNIPHLREFEAVVRALDPCKVVVHSPVGYSTKFFPHLFRIVDEYCTEFVLHDYTWVCPKSFLVDHHGMYCGLQSGEACQRCIAANPGFIQLSTEHLRSLTHVLLRGSRVLAPSKDVVRRYQILFPDVAIFLDETFAKIDRQIMVEQHAMSSVQSPWRQGGKPRVGIVGPLTPHKGLDRVLQLLQLEDASKGVEFLVFGSAPDELKEFGVVILGEFTPGTLPLLINQFQPDVWFFPSLAPETYSFALTEAILTDSTIIAPNFGAFIERSKNHSQIALYEYWAIPEKILQAILAAVRL